MYRNHRIVVVIPARDEVAFIGEVLKGMPDYVDHMIVIDDGSTDGTQDAARAVADPRIKIIRNEASVGVGGATVLGFSEALTLKADIVVKMDGDGQMAPQDLGTLLNAVIDRPVDYAKGNRLLGNGFLERMPRRRLLGNIMLTFLTKIASGYWHVFDPQNGFTAIRADALRTLDLSRLNKGFFFENDMLVELNIHGLRVADVPMPARYGSESSHLSIPLTLAVFPWLFFMRLLRRIYQKYVLRDISPIALFLLFGFPLFAGGAAFGIYLWIQSSITGHLTPTGTIMLALIPIVLGFQLLLQAIVLDIQETPK